MTTLPAPDPQTATRLSGTHWSPVDRYSNWTLVLLLALVATAAMAIVGLPPVSIHGPNHYAGWMAPTCGMTRAVRFLAMGDLGQAWRYNPAVFVLAAIGVAGVARTAIGVVTGRWWQPELRHRRLLIAVAVVAVAVLWINQQSNAELLMGP